MAARSWPFPTDDDIKVSRSGLEIQAQAHGMDLEDPATASFIDHWVMVMAEKQAQIRWLSNLLHDHVDRETPK